MINIWFQSSNHEMILETAVESYNEAEALFRKIDMEFEKQLQSELAHHTSHDFCACEFGANTGGFRFQVKAVYDHESDSFTLNVQRGERKNVLGMIPVNRKRGKQIDNLVLYEVFEYFKSFFENPARLFDNPNLKAQ